MGGSIRMRAYIKAIEYSLPDQVVTNDALVEEFPEWSVDKIADKVGVSKRHVAAPEETSKDLAVRAAEKIFENNKELDKSSIDFVIFCTQSPDYFLPTSACLIQNELGLPTSCGALDFNLGCSGYVYGLSLAKGLMAAGLAKNILLLTGETYSKFIHPRDKGNRTIFGDAGSATLISSEGFAEIADFSFGTDGRGAENLIVKSGAMRNRETMNDVVFEDGGNPVSSDHLYMNGSEIFNFTIDAVPALVNDTLSKNGLTKDEVDGYVFHQANKFMLDFLRKKIKIEKEKFHIYLSEVGNTVSSTIPITLKEKMNESAISGNIVLAGFGVGYSWAGCVIRVGK